jgi:hypothetical protein
MTVALKNANLVLYSKGEFYLGAASPYSGTSISFNARPFIAMGERDANLVEASSEKFINTYENNTYKNFQKNIRGFYESIKHAGKTLVEKATTSKRKYWLAPHFPYLAEWVDDKSIFISLLVGSIRVGVILTDSIGNIAITKDPHLAFITNKPYSGLLLGLLTNELFAGIQSLFMYIDDKRKSDQPKEYRSEPKEYRSNEEALRDAASILGIRHEDIKKAETPMGMFEGFGRPRWLGVYDVPKNHLGVNRVGVGYYRHGCSDEGLIPFSGLWLIDDGNNLKQVDTSFQTTSNQIENMA